MPAIVKSNPPELLTICSVSYKSRALLDLNWKLTNRLNGPGQFRWIVVENTELGAEQQVPPEDERFYVLEGVKTEKVGMHASANHAAGLNKALDHVATRYVLFLDPDFFLVREKWITDAVAHMQTRRLSFFGAPYHPDRYYEYRYF